MRFKQLSNFLTRIGRKLGGKCLICGRKTFYFKSLFESRYKSGNYPLKNRIMDYRIRYCSITCACRDKTMSCNMYSKLEKSRIFKWDCVIEDYKNFDNDKYL